MEKFLPEERSGDPLGHARVINRSEFVGSVANITFFCGFIGVLEPLEQTILMNISNRASTFTWMQERL